MARKLILVIIISAIIIGGGIWQEVYMEKTFSEFERKIDALEKAHAEEPLKPEQVKELHDWWQKKHASFENFLPHLQLNEIEMTFGELMGTVVAEDTESATGQILRLKFTVSAIAEMFNIRFGNIV
ncbi:MAG: DUF4363 family protein [Firmicutes bacterium]|nr:DUF4363 family protein [Bacillota bacterium]